MLTPAEFGALFADFRREAFRLETLPEYRVPEEAGEVAAYVASGPAPATIGGTTDWRRVLARGRAAGRHFSRVHIVRSPLTDYLRYECEWGYAYNMKLGEVVSILDLSEVDYGEPLPPWDFWLFDNETGVRMHYAADGDFEGGELVAGADVDQLAGWRQQVEAAAAGFTAYWAAHPEYHRQA